MRAGRGPCTRGALLNAARIPSCRACRRQLDYIHRICALYEQDPENFEELLVLVQEASEAGLASIAWVSHGRRMAIAQASHAC